MKRAVLALVTLGVVAGAAAQTDPIEARRALMRGSGAGFYGALPKMIRGDAPYDQARVDAAFAQAADSAAKLPALFPESSKSGGAPSDYAASPRIWENKADFDARLAKYAKDIAEARANATGPENLKAAFSLVRQNCDSCHESYRVRVK